MPTLSINKNDLEDLGISLKDILLAITKSKHSNGDVIKIKKRKQKRKKKVKAKPLTTFKPFPNQTGGGGGGVFGNIAPAVTKIEVKTDPQNNNAEINAKLDYMNLIQNYSANGLYRIGYHIVNNGLQGQNIPPPSGLSDIKPISFRPNPRVEEVDINDGYGNISSQDPFSNQSTAQFDIQQPAGDQPIEPLDAGDQQSVSNQPYIDQSLPIPSFEPNPGSTTDAFAMLKNSQASAINQNVKTKQGSKNQQKDHPLSSENIMTSFNRAATRSSHQQLINQDFKTPTKYAKQQQEHKDDEEKDDNEVKDDEVIAVTKNKTSKLPKTSSSSTAQIPKKTGIFGKIKKTLTPKNKSKDNIDNIYDVP